MKNKILVFVHENNSTQEYEYDTLTNELVSKITGRMLFTDKMKQLRKQSGYIYYLLDGVKFDL